MILNRVKIVDILWKPENWRFMLAEELNMIPCLREVVYSSTVYLFMNVCRYLGIKCYKCVKDYDFTQDCTPFL